MTGTAGIEYELRRLQERFDKLAEKLERLEQERQVYELRRLKEKMKQEFRLDYLTITDDKSVLFTQDQALRAGFSNNTFMLVYRDSNSVFDRNSFYLSDRYNWKLFHHKGNLLLHPTKKEP